MNHQIDSYFFQKQNFPIEQPSRIFDLQIKSIVFGEIIKESIGQDLGKISVPVYFNEPISMLKTEGPIRTNEVSEFKAKKDEVAAVNNLVNDESNSIKPSSPV